MTGKHWETSWLGDFVTGKPFPSHDIVIGKLFPSHDIINTVSQSRYIGVYKARERIHRDILIHDY